MGGATDHTRPTENDEIEYTAAGQVITYQPERSSYLTAKGHAAVDAMRDGDEFTVRNLTDNHFGCEVTVTGLTGTLVGLVPVGEKVQAALIVGGAHIWTDALPGDTAVEIQRQEAS